MAQEENIQLPDGPQPEVTEPTQQTQVTGQPAVDVPEKPPEIDWVAIKRNLEQTDTGWRGIKKRIQRDAGVDFNLAFNGALADMLDLPGEASAALVNLIPWEDLGFSELPSGGFRQAFEEMGLTVPSSELPDTAATSVGRFTGGTAPFLLSAPLGAGQTAAQTAQFGFREGARRLAQQVGQTAVQRPASFAGQELTASAGAGFLGFAARENFPNSDVASFYGEMIGGMISGGVVITPTRIALRGLSNAAKSIRFALSGEGGTIRAARRVAEDVIDPTEAIQRLREPGVSPEAEALLTPAQRTGDPLLLSLEKTIIDQNGLTEFQQNERIRRLNDVIVDSLTPREGEAELTRQVFESQREYLKDLLSARIEMATIRVQEKLVNLEATSGRAEANLAAKEEFRSALLDARNTENQLWQMIPLQEIQLTPSASGGAWRKEVERFTRNRGLRSDTIPDDLEFGQDKKNLRQLLGTFDESGNWAPGEIAGEASLEEIQSMRSTVLAAVREERGKTAPNADRIRILNNLADALLTDMGVAKQGTSTDVGVMMEQALAFSNELNTRFTKGPVSKILGFGRTGAPEIPDSLTLETMLSGGGPRAKENFDRMVAAVKDNPRELQGAVENYIKLEFQRNAVSNSQINSAQAEAFLKRNEQILDSFPQVKSDIQEAIRADNIALIRQRKAKTIGARLGSPRVSKLALFIEKDPPKAFEDVWKSRNVSSGTDNIVKLAQRDPTGEAMEGLREGFFAWVLQRSRTRSLSAGGGDVVSSAQFSRVLNDPKTAVMMQKILTPQQIERLRFAGKEALIKDMTQTARPSKKGLMNDISGKILRVVKVLGAQAFNKLSRESGMPSTLQGPQFASQQAQESARRFALDKGEKILVDAFLSEDPKLLEALLMEVKSTRDQQFVNRQIQAWLAVTLYENREQIGDVLLGDRP